MAKAIIMRCPDCGQWCQTEERGVLSRAGERYKNTVEACSTTGYDIGDTLGAEASGALLGGTLSGPITSNVATGETLGNKYQFECPNCGQKWETDNDADDQSTEYKKEQEIIQYAEAGQWEKALQMVNDCLKSYPQYRAHYLNMKGNILLNKGTIQHDDEIVYDDAILAHAVRMYTQAIQACKNNKAFLTTIFTNRAWANLHRDYCDYSWVRTDSFLVARYGDPETNAVSIEEAQEMFNVANEGFLMEFTLLPYSSRKTVLVVDHYSIDIDNEQIIVLSKADAEETLRFPAGHPLINHLYVGHPIVQDYYVPFEEYQLILVENQVRELCELVQALGAKKITIKCQNDTSSDSTEKPALTVSGSEEQKAYHTEGQYQGKSGQHLIERIRQSVEMQQTYNPTQSPYIPEDLVWYDQMPSWQRLARQRIKGKLDQHKERLQTSKLQMLDASELKQIRANLAYLLADANINIDIDKEYNFQAQDNAILEIEIDFTPVSQLKDGKTPQADPEPADLNNAQQQFYDVVQSYLQKGKELTKNCMEQKRIKIGKSEQPAKEIIKTYRPSLSSEE